MSDISQPRAPEFLGAAVVVVLISLLAACAKGQTDFDWRLVSNIKKEIQAPHSGYFEWANRRSWYSGFYGDPTRTCKEQVSKRETIVCRPKFAGAFKTQDGPVAVSDIVAAFQARAGFKAGFSYDFTTGGFHFSRFDYKSTRFYLVGYRSGSKCEDALSWSTSPTGRAAGFCDKDVSYVLLSGIGVLVADFFPLSAASARFASQIVA
jgi:hypothetical protein